MNREIEKNKLLHINNISSNYTGWCHAADKNSFPVFLYLVYKGNDVYYMRTENYKNRTKATICI